MESFAVDAISSRTPEGSPNHCPVCGKGVQIEPSVPMGDAPCPHCGHLLWFVAIHPELQFFLPGEAIERRRRVVALLAAQLGVSVETLTANPEVLTELGMESIDTVELVMELEELFD